MSFTENLKKQVYNKLRSDYQVFIEHRLKSIDIQAPVDIMINKSCTKYLVELEIHRADPSNNIAKIAYWLESNPDINVEVIQVFSPYYLQRNGNPSAKMKLAKFLGQRLIETGYMKKYHIIEVESKKKVFEKNYKQYRTQPEKFNYTIMEELANQITKKIGSIVK